MLVDLGCVFIGHGLNKDFRIISASCALPASQLVLTPRSPDIYIPPEQIIDTVNIYHLPHRQRKLSLRFLAWAVLHSAIQTDTHDSIEDARTALQLYEEHNRLEAEGTWEDVLEEVYREGKQTVRLRFSPARLALTPRFRRTSKCLDRNRRYLDGWILPRLALELWGLCRRSVSSSSLGSELSSGAMGLDAGRPSCNYLVVHDPRVCSAAPFWLAPNRLRASFMFERERILRSTAVLLQAQENG